MQEGFRYRAKAGKDVIVQIMENQNSLLKNVEGKSQGMKYDTLFRFMHGKLATRVTTMDLHCRFLEMVTEKVKETSNIEMLNF